MKLRLTALLASAIFLLCVSILGIVRSVGATAGYAIYHHTRYLQKSENSSAVIAACVSAYSYYPYNYRFAEWCAETAYFEGMSVGGNEREYLLSAAEYWCGIGLQINPYRGKLRMLRARFLSMDDPGKAIVYWKEYVDWDYWNPINHCELAGLYAMAGDFDKAFKALDVIKGRAYYDEGLKRVNHFWRKEMEMPDLPLSK